ncbi:hypothetical protein BFW01_g2087 [Lasiodiplodia theobromae]|nr:hypothetical protein BFW01_g2087 [Lasiodiplodia theobromae]
MATASDPLDWSVEDVVDALCKSRDWWIQGRPNAPMPDPASLEEHLREEEVNGFALLTYFTSEQKLKDGLGIKTIGRVSAVSWAIDKLREQSPKYADHLATQTAISAPSMVQSVAGSSTYGRPVGGWLGSLPPPSEQFRTGLATPTHEGMLPTVLETEEEMNPQPAGPVDQATMTTKRPGETIIQDASGRKKRRLALAATPTTSANTVQTQLPFSPSSRKSFPVDMVFYGDASFGQTLEEDDDMDFQHHGKAHHILSPYIYRQFLHFIRNPDRREFLQENGKKITTIQPYRSALLPENRPRAVTVFEHTDKGIRATKQDALRVQSNILFDSNLPYDDDSDQQNSGWYGFAEKWKHGDDEILPPLGESDEEESSSYEAELDAEERERTLQQWKQPQLSKEEVSTIVQQRIHELGEIWKQRKLPLRQRTARTIWRKARRPNAKRVLRTAAENEVKTIDRRLNKLKEAIVDLVWHRREDVIQQCATLEESVSQREEQLWLLSVWDLKAEPPAIKTVPRRTTKRPPKPRDRDFGEESGESLDSESELDSGGLEDFIEQDEDVMQISPKQSATAKRRRQDEMSPELDTASMADVSDEVGSVGPITAEDSDVDLVDAPYASSLPTTPKRLQLPPPESAPRSTHSVIDLTALSDGVTTSDSSPIPGPSFSRPSVIPGSLISASQIQPEYSTIAEIEKWKFYDLEERNDKKRLVLKILRTSVGEEEYKQMREYATTVTRKTLHDQVWQTMTCLCRNNRVRNITDQEWVGLVKFARLYTCWNKVLHTPWSSPPDKLAGYIRKIVEKLDTPQNKHDFSSFFDFVIGILKRYPSPSSDVVSAHATSGEEDEPAPVNTPHKRRKNIVKQSDSAIKLRKSAQKRAEVQVEIERAFQERAGSSQSQTDRLIINPGQFGTDGAIHINPSIGSRIKAHQIEGVKFMWRELVEAGHTDAQGCLLAHTMGLGKTMQVYVNADDPPVARLKKIFNWDEHGGILVMSYEMFRNFLSEKNSVRTSKEELRDLQGALLEGPSIIVADEAHKMKSVKSTIREVVDKFKSKARLALTGSPLANNLTEYWSMIDWVSPGYLGSQKEFKAHFVEPIEEGLYKDSTPYEHRKALKKLHVLKSEIGPKISRANITVLKDDLKSKVEFVITVPLTALQEELYNLCIRQLLVGDRKKITTTRMWVWIHLLNLLCCHPAVFVNKLKDQQARRDNAGDKPRANAQRAVVEESDANEQQDVLPEDQNLDDEMRGSFTNSFIEQAVSILDQAHDNTSPRHSFKTRILMQIIRLSKAAGDRVLVFSQQLNSLTYLESVLASQNYRYIRLDGKTKMSNRPALMEDFNRGKFDVFLISTKAGGTGFNLQGANRVIILDCGFNPQNEEQAIGRAYRIGQEKEVFVYRMIVGGTFEPKVWNSALFKTQLALRTVDAKNPERQAAKMREYFFEPTPVEQGDLTGDQGKDKKVLDKILAQQREGKDAGLRSITTTETLMTEDLDAVLNEEENEEVKKMIQAERLRKENPQAWEQYLRDNPAIDDSRNNPPNPEFPSGSSSPDGTAVPRVWRTQFYWRQSDVIDRTNLYA